MFKPVPLVVSVLASSGSIFLSMPSVLAQRTCNGTQAVTTQVDGYTLPCMEVVDGAPMSGYQCTSKDVRFARVEILELRDGDENVIEPVNGQYECERGQELLVNFVATLNNGAGSPNFDLAVFWSSGTDEDAAKTGNDCAYSSFTAVGTSNNTEPPR